MKQSHQDPRFPNRRWIAWKLVRLAHRIYDAEIYERIWIEDANGSLLFDAEICSDLYGDGVSTFFAATHTLPAGSTVHHDNDHIPDWLEDL